MANNEKDKQNNNNKHVINSKLFFTVKFDANAIRL